jgi:hypothetical protein
MDRLSTTLNFFSTFFIVFFFIVIIVVVVISFIRFIIVSFVLYVVFVFFTFIILAIHIFRICRDGLLRLPLDQRLHDLKGTIKNLSHGFRPMLHEAVSANSR